MVEWSREKIAGLSNERIESLRENAANHRRHDIVDLCGEELARRKPSSFRKRQASAGEDHRREYVSEFHFVCPSELGITRNSDGTIWSGTWVVDKEHAENAVRYSSMIALHSSKVNASYLQGTIRDWRKSPRQPRYSGEQETQIREGIDFLFEPSDSPLLWEGLATGEKGYVWKPFAA